jgi:hypothetical protein
LIRWLKAAKTHLKKPTRQQYKRLQMPKTKERAHTDSACQSRETMKRISNGFETHTIQWLDHQEMPIGAISAAWAATKRVKIRHGPSAACWRQTTDVTVRRAVKQGKRENYHFVVESKGNGSFTLYGTQNCCRRVWWSVKIAMRNFWHGNTEP